MSTGLPVDTGGDVCTAQIDTTIPGSVESVDSAADWLKLLRDGLHDARTMFNNAATLTNADLSGELASAVVAYSNDLSAACDDAYNRAKKAVDVIRSFADQLGWRKDDMAEHRETAIAGGLTGSSCLWVWWWMGGVCGVGHREFRWAAADAGGCRRMVRVRTFT